MCDPAVTDISLQRCNELIGLIPHHRHDCADASTGVKARAPVPGPSDRPRTEKGFFRILCGISHFRSSVGAKNKPSLRVLEDPKGDPSLPNRAARWLRRRYRGGHLLVEASRNLSCTFRWARSELIESEPWLICLCGSPCMISSAKSASFTQTLLHLPLFIENLWLVG